MKTTLLALFLSTAAIAQTYTITEHGATCGADLGAQLVATPHGPALRINMHSGLNHALAVLVIGTHRLVPAAQLPGPSQCELVVMPRVNMFDMTNANGNAHFAFRIPPTLPIEILFQGVALQLTPHGTAAASSDVVKLIGQ